MESTDNNCSTPAGICWASAASSPASWAAVKIRPYVPSVDQRKCRFHTVCHGPKSTGTSRHGDPVRYRQQMPSSITR